MSVKWQEARANINGVSVVFRVEYRKPIAAEDQPVITVEASSPVEFTVTEYSD